MAASNSQDVSKTLHTWLFKEMGFSEGSITPGNLKSICKGPMVDVWSYVMNSVKSSENVQTIKKNLALHGKLQPQANDEKRAELLKQKKKLEAEVSSLCSAVKVLQEELHEEKKLVSNSEQELVVLNRRLQDAKRVIHLQKLEYQNLSSKIYHWQEKSKELDEALQSIVGTREGSDSSVLEIEGVYREMENFITSLVSLEDLQPTSLKDKKAEFGILVSSALNSSHRSTVARCLLQLQCESLDNIQQQTKEKEETTFQSSDKWEPLQPLLHELCWTYVSLQTAAKKAQTEVEALERELELKRQTVQQKLIEFAKTKPEVADSVKPFLDLRLQLSSRKAAVDYLKKAAEDLERLCLDNKQREEEIKTKMKDINANKRKIQHLAVFICTLVRRNWKALGSIVKTLQSSKQKGKDEVKAANQFLVRTTETTKSLSGQRHQLLSGTSPSNFFQVEVNGKVIAADHLSMNRLVPRDPDTEIFAAEHLTSALKILEMEALLPVQLILDAVVKRSENVWELQQLGRLRENFRKGKGVVSRWMDDSLALASELEKEVEEKRSKQEKQLIPVLESRIAKLPGVQQSFRELKISYEEWWNEPAQLIDTGIRVEDMTLAQWRQQWSKALAACRKIHK